MAVVLLMLGYPTGAGAAPFAVTLKNAETIQLVDLATINRTGKLVTYQTVMMVPADPSSEVGGTSHLIEDLEARCETNESRRTAMAVVGLDGEASMAPIDNDPWFKGSTLELRIVCDPSFDAVEIIKSIEAARRAMIRAGSI